MARALKAFFLASGVLLCFASSASAGGTVVIAPDKPTSADCYPGNTPRFEGFEPKSLIVLGCTTPARSAAVVVAADNSDAFACFYVSPPSGRNEGPCAQVRSTERLFGGPLNAHKRSSSPITGGNVISALQIGRYPSGTYVSGLVPASADQVTVSPGRIGAGPSFEPAALLKVPLPLGAGIGASHSFSVFVARVSPKVDTCTGIRIVARTDDGPLSADVSKSDAAFPAEAAPLPGTRGCAAKGAWGVAMAIEDVGKAVPSASRSKS